MFGICLFILGFRVGNGSKEYIYIWGLGCFKVYIYVLYDNNIK